MLLRSLGLHSFTNLLLIVYNELQQLELNGKTFIATISQYNLNVEYCTLYNTLTVKDQ